MDRIDEALDDLDRAIMREAGALRSQIAARSNTDDAWADFLAATATGSGAVEMPQRHRRRWVGVAAAVLVAASVVSLVLLHQSRPPAPHAPDVTDPVPPTTAGVSSTGGYSVVTLRENGEIVAVGAGRADQVIGRIPPPAPQAGGGFSADVSASGWVATTQFLSEGFWFYDLHHPATAPRFVSIEGPIGGHESLGVWNPAGTRYAASEGERAAAVIDPSTGSVARLASTDPPIGYPPTWTADGSGILTGEAAADCVTPGSVRARRLAIVPIDGGPESAVVPQLADSRNEVTTGGRWLHLDRCTFDPSDGLRIDAPKVVVVDGTEVQTWIDHLEGQVLLASALSPGRGSVWALTRSPDATGPLLLWEAVEPLKARVVASFSRGALRQVADFTGEAPDGSAVVVTVGSASYLVPTDGSRVTPLIGSFAGFVPQSLLDELAQR